MCRTTQRLWNLLDRRRCSSPPACIPVNARSPSSRWRRPCSTRASNARFTLVGPDEGEGPALRAALDGESQISWEGALAPGAIPRRMAAASVYVLPSVREPYPMSVLEAMSVGLPVVVSADCGLAPLVERTHCGIVTDPRSRPWRPRSSPSWRTRLSRVRWAAERANTVRTELGMRAVGDRLDGHVYRPRARAHDARVIGGTPNTFRGWPFAIVLIGDVVTASAIAADRATRRPIVAAEHRRRR